MAKLIVDDNACIGCGACVGVCNEVFEFSDEGTAQVKEEKQDIDSLSEEVKNDAMDALEGCPTSAIKLEEK